MLVELKSNINYQDIPVIPQSSSFDEAEIAKVYHMGINGYIKKLVLGKKINNNNKDELSKL